MSTANFSHGELYESIKRVTDVYNDKFDRVMAPVVCLLGSIMNILNLIVLNQKSMRNAVNFYLSSIAASDLITMTVYFVYSIRIYRSRYICITESASYFGVVFGLFQGNVAVISHTVSLWISTIMAAVRYMTVKNAEKGHSSSMQTAKAMKVTAATVLMTIVLTTPNFGALAPNKIAFNISRDPRCSETSNTFRYVFKINCSICMTLAYWVLGLLFKMVPCILLAVFVFLLIRNLRLVHARRKEMFLKMKKNSSASKKQAEQTTRMLVAVLVIFLVTEIPQGIGAVLIAANRTKFAPYIQLLYHVINMLSLLNCATNFIIYCIMSAKFRTTFYQLFCPKACMPAAVHEYRRVTRRKRKSGASNLGVVKTGAMNGDAQHDGIAILDLEHDDAPVSSSNLKNNSESCDEEEGLDDIGAAIIIYSPLTGISLKLANSMVTDL